MRSEDDFTIVTAERGFYHVAGRQAGRQEERLL
jgi:hypothetical protein